MKKTTKSNLITYAMVIVIFAVVQILVATGSMSSLMQGLLVPLCTYSIVAIGLNLCVGYLGELSLGVPVIPFAPSIIISPVPDILRALLSLIAKCRPFSSFPT